MTDFSAVNTALTAERDIYGETISVGDLVRSFDFPFLFDNGEIAGLDVDYTDRTSYLEGTVLAIGDEVFEGCKRYTIETIRRVNARGGVLKVSTEYAGEHVHPPVNGVRICGSTRRTFGVVKITQ